MKSLNFMVATLFAGILACGFPAFCQETETAPVSKEEFFMAQGTVTQVDSEQKIIRLKIEAGLELTFHAGDVPTFMDLAAGDSIEIKYNYNQNYEKVVREIVVKNRAPREGEALNAPVEAASEKPDGLVPQNGDGKN